MEGADGKVFPNNDGAGTQFSNNDMERARSVKNESVNLLRTKQMEQSQFTRDSTLELAAMEQLGYTVDQIKRKTIAQLQRELQKHAKEQQHTPSPLRNVDSGSSSSSTSNSTSNSSAGKKRVTFELEQLDSGAVDEDPVVVIRRLEATIHLKEAFTATLEQDSDFTDDDLVDWHASIEQLQNQLGHYRTAHAERLQKLWERKQSKLKAMEQQGLLEPKSLAQKWAQKQSQNKL